MERTENDNGQPTRLIYFTGGKLDFTLITADELATATYDRGLSDERRKHRSSDSPGKPAGGYYWDYAMSKSGGCSSLLHYD